MATDLPPIVLDIETSGLDAQNDWITCIGILAPATGIRQFTHSAKAFRTDPGIAEENILVEFSEWFHETFQHGHCDSPILTYNGETFDLPFIDVRAARHASPKIFMGEFPPKKHIDLSKFVKAQSGRYISKDVAADHLANLYVPRSVHGGFLARIYKYKRVTDEQHLNMLQHNAIDLATTMKMWNVLKDFPDFDEWMLKGLMPNTLTEHGDR